MLCHGAVILSGHYVRWMTAPLPPMSTAEPLPAEALRDPALFLNRELSLLAFNRRVLEQAMDTATPLLERLKFLCISSNNLDEFFEIRAARLQQQVASGSVQAGPDNLGATELLKRVGEEGHQLVAEQYRVLNEVLLPLLEKEKIRFLRRTEWNATQEAWVRGYFEKRTAAGIEPARARPGASVPAHPQQKPEFHRFARRASDAFGRRGAASPCCRHRAPCRA